MAPLSMDRRKAAQGDLIKVTPKKMHPLFGWQPRVPAAHRLARRWAVWALCSMQDVQSEVEVAAAIESSARATQIG